MGHWPVAQPGIFSGGASHCSRQSWIFKYFEQRWFPMLQLNFCMVNFCMECHWLCQFNNSKSNKTT